MTDPLDLRAVAEKLRVLDSDPNGVLSLADEKAPLATLRAHRKALTWALPFAERAVLQGMNVYPAAVAKLTWAIAALATVHDAGDPE